MNTVMFRLILIIVMLAGMTIPSTGQKINKEDSLALVDLYNQTDGPNWLKNINWLRGPVIKWHGVKLTKDSIHVVEIALEGNRLSGKLPITLGNLTKCEVINFAHNQLCGSIPEQLAILPSLRTLYLPYNKLSGKVPESLGRQPALGYVVLNGNKFTFDGIESVVRNQQLYKYMWLIYSSQDTILPIKSKGNMLTVSAGGTPANNTYQWYHYSGALDTTIVGDSTFIPKKVGAYHVVVSNSIATNLKFKSSIFYPSIAVFNPNPTLLFGSSIPYNLPYLYYRDTASKAATDGVTKLLLVTYSEHNDPVTFTLNGDNIGTLSSWSSQQTTNTKQITVTPDWVSGLVVAIYTVPDGYGKENLPGKNVSVTATNSTGVIGKSTIELFKPPVVLVHGMWSNPEIWQNGGFVDALKKSGFTTAVMADYSLHSAETFNPLSPTSIHGRTAVADAVKSALQAYRSQRIAVAKVDIVGHSLGGLMSRSWSQQLDFKKPDNYNQGYIHKLITLGTPHRGSPLGPELFASRNNLVKLPYSVVMPDYFSIKTPIPLRFLLALLNMPVGSCHPDFGINSPGINELRQTPPYHTYSIVGDQTGQLLAFSLFYYFSLAALNHNYFEIFKAHDPCTNTLDHDLVVPLSSQKGYIPTTKTFYATGHSIPALTTETNSPEIQAKVIDLLLSDDAREFSAGFPAPSNFPLDCTTANQRTSSSFKKSGNELLQVFDTSAKAIKIFSPDPGIVYHTGDSNTTVKLRYEAVGGAKPYNCIFLVQDVGWFTVTDSLTNSTSFTLPRRINVGRLNIAVLAKDSSGITLGDTTHIDVRHSSVLDSLSVTSVTVELDSSIRQKSLYVQGHYTSLQGVHTASRISHSSTGTTYQPKNGYVFSVSPDGHLTAIKAGTDTLIISNSGKTINLSVIVDTNFNSATLYRNSIDFATIPDKKFGDAPFVLDAISLSGEIVQFDVIQGAVSVSNGVVSLSDALGEIVIKAFVPRSVYFDSVTAYRSFSVLPNKIYTFTGNGSWTDPKNWENHEVAPTIVPSGTKISINPVGDGECLLNESIIISKGALLSVEKGKKIKIAGDVTIDKQ